MNLIKQICFATLFTLFSVASLAKEQGHQHLHLYKAPKQKATVSAKIEPSERLIPIIMKNNQWLKVARAKNGQVGWIQRAELERMQQKPQFHQTTIQQQDGHGQSVIQYTGSEPLSKEELAKQVKIIERQHRQMNRHMQQVFKQMNREMRAMERMFDEPMIEDDETLPVVYESVNNEQDQKAHANDKKDTSWWEQVKAKLKLGH